jgi:uncharacterized DUF497 family protein
MVLCGARRYFITMRDDAIHVISFRKASRRERKRYEQAAR